MGRLSILIYHRVLQERDPLQPDIVDAATFRRQMRWLRRAFRVLPLPLAVEQLRRRRLPSRAACITFDDGYADNYEVALPILRSLGLSATFFIATGFLDGGRMWNDTVIESVRRWGGRELVVEGLDLPPLSVRTLAERRAAIAKVLPSLKYLEPWHRERVCNRLAEEVGGCDLPRPMMRSWQVAQLVREGMTVGAHTRTHPILARIGPKQARAEIKGSLQDLEGVVGSPIEVFAYPNGKPCEDYGPEHVQLLREFGVQAAVSTVPGVADPGLDPLQLPRFTPWDRDPARFVGRLAWSRWMMRTATSMQSAAVIT